MVKTGISVNSLLWNNFNLTEKLQDNKDATLILSTAPIPLDRPFLKKPLSYTCKLIFSPIQ